MGYNTLWYAGAGTYWFFRIASDLGGAITPGALALGQLMDEIDPLKKYMYRDNEEDDGPQIEPFDWEAYEPPAVQPPKLRGGPSGSQAASSSKGPKPSKPQPVSVSRRAKPGLRDKATTYVRNLGKSMANDALGLTMSV